MVRRTTSIDISLAGESIDLLGSARDLLTGEAGADSVIADAEVEAEVGPGNRLVRLRTRPDAGSTNALLDVVVAGGFRARVAECLPAQGTTPLGSMLDDLPIATMLAGYIRLREAARPGSTTTFPIHAVGPDRMADLCSGWRTGGTLGIVVDAMFRDSYGEPDGTEVVLHEYGVHASFDRARMSVDTMEADPHVLPYAECPAAAASARLLIGRSAAELPRAVRNDLAGTVGCTHLNDLYRSLAGVPALFAGAA